MAAFVVPIVTAILLMLTTRSFGAAGLWSEAAIGCGFRVSVFLIGLGAFIVPVVLFPSLLRWLRGVPPNVDGLEASACQGLLGSIAAGGSSRSNCPQGTAADGADGPRVRLAEEAVFTMPNCCGKRAQVYYMILDEFSGWWVGAYLWRQGDHWWALIHFTIMIVSRFILTGMLRTLGFGSLRAWLQWYDVECAIKLTCSTASGGPYVRWARYVEVRWLVQSLFHAPLMFVLEYYMVLRSIELKRPGFRMEPFKANDMGSQTVFSVVAVSIQMGITLNTIAEHARKLKTTVYNYIPAVMQGDDEMFQRFVG
mmetsp:Transcript_18428/g.43322  ORF Transcript_18428/g.43322 Transcript_18428/m.43322 type:complete len:310 (-) Transcript_18428:118-1047(-)